MAANAVRWRDGEARGAGRQQADGRDANPSAATMRRGQELHAARRHLGGRRPGNPELRPPSQCRPLRRAIAWIADRSAPWASGCRWNRYEKIAKPDKQVIVVHGDGSFGLNALELDTAVRHNIAILVVVSLNGGWTADPQRNKPGRNLGYTRFDKMAETLGCYGEYVERPDEIRPALNRAQREVDRGSVALVNVKTDDRARATTVTFAQYAT